MISSVRTTLVRLPRTLRLCLTEARPLVQAVFVLRYLTGGLAALTGEVSTLPNLLLGALAWWAATVAIYLYNGLSDLPEDLVNGSRRPLASGRLAAPAARVVTLALAALAPALAAGAAPALVPCVFGYLALGFWYSAPRGAAKRRGWSATLSTTAAALLSYVGGCLAGGGALTTTALAVGGVMSLWVGLIGAVTKDLGSTAGDARAGRRTLAVTRGENAARRFSAVCALALSAIAVVGSAALAGLPAQVSGIVPPPEATGICAPYFSTILAAKIALLAGACVLSIGSLKVAQSCFHPIESRPRAPYRAGMATQYAVHLVVALALACGFVGV
ncbi:UbiA family prenyltransferase [Streptomyces sp. BI20]|uniref:UbiA family prenyltransferase n=1 Tax=Streptomyces sp. BI20 TaxID=3403460 RepID=UPI003C73466D